MKQIAKIREEVLCNPWLVTMEAYNSLRTLVEQEFIRGAKIEATESIADPLVGDIAVLPMYGTFMKGISPAVEKYFGLVNTDRIKAEVIKLREDESVKGVVLDIDSAGGSATGIMETAEEVAKLAEVKPVYSVTEGMMASAAYWIGSQANMVFATKSSKVGSIGVYLPVVDSSAAYENKGVKVELIKNKEATYKGAGFEGTKLSDDQKEYMQEMVQQIFADFKEGVLSSRPNIGSETMRGQVYLGKKAKEKALIDINGSAEEAITILKMQLS